MKYNILLLIALLMFFGGCSSNNDNRIDNTSDKRESADLSCHLIVQPYGDFAQGDAYQIARSLIGVIGKYTDISIDSLEVLPNKPLTAELMNNAKTRYRASKILDSQHTLQHRQGDVIIGLTNCDISTSLHGYEDWGILGLAYLGQSNCVISTFRVREKKYFWKVVFHEYLHAYKNLPHCSDPSCFMVDCNGKPKLSLETRLCNDCAKLLQTLASTTTH